MMSAKPPVCLTIAGLDPSGGAGIIADIKTFSRFGCFATAAISSLTFQNTTGVFGAVHQTAASIRGQIQPVIDDFDVAAIKTGMLPTAETIQAVAALVRRNQLRNLVVDPVVRSTSGFDLIDESALKSLIETLFPLATLVTPNLPEAERITGIAILSEEDIEPAARLMQSMGVQNVLIKGGHALGKQEVKQQSEPKVRKAKDFLFVGDDVHVFEADLIETTSTHGTGCTLSAAIAANLALGKDLIESVRVSKEFVIEAIRTAPGLGNGASPINI
jgi:hydroxymethylpyrimidine kinase/phosphomethylpyrimidine kinase